VKEDLLAGSIEMHRGLLIKDIYGPI